MPVPSTRQVAVAGVGITARPCRSRSTTREFLGAGDPGIDYFDLLRATATIRSVSVGDRVALEEVVRPSTRQGCGRSSTASSASTRCGPPSRTWSAGGTSA
jgi:hypothetical protein